MTEEKYGFKVHTAYIAEVKRELGLPMYDASNAVEELKYYRIYPAAKKEMQRLTDAKSEKSTAYCKISVS